MGASEDKMKNIKQFIPAIIICLFSFLLLGLAIKGRHVLNYYQLTLNKSIAGPFESSSSTSRYALTQAIVEDHTVIFNEARARFASPDVVKYKDKFFSIFTPGVSFFGVPFYMAGKFLGYPQLFTYLSTIFLALLNTFLVAKITRKFGGGFYTSILAGFIFLFATNALAYSLTFTQHHPSTTLILLGMLNLFGKRTFLKNVWLGSLFGMAILVDIPNIFLMSPFLIFAFLQHFQFIKAKEKINLIFKLNLVGLMIGLLPLLAIFGWYNYTTAGSYTKIGQTIGRSGAFSPEVAKLIEKAEKNPELSPARLPLQTRFQLNGLYILLISNERGLFYYTPVVLIGLIGLYFLLKNNQEPQNKSIAFVLLTGVLINILIYSMFGDPWGGWSFGPRYLIPSLALLCSLLGITVQQLKQKIWFIILFLILTAYSVGVSLVGATTTNMVPPKQEAINLLQPIPYTYEYNLQLIKENMTSSLFYNVFLAGRISVQTFVIIYFSLVLLLILGLYTLALFAKQDEK